MSLKDLRYLANNPIPNQFYDRRTIHVWAYEVLQLFLIIDEYDKCINEMRDENKIHGHITDSSAQYLINIKPMYESMRVIAESNLSDQRAGLPGSDELRCWARYAQLFATKYHQGQFRRDGVTPYINHPAAVAGVFESDYCRSVAWLHDVLEDTDADIGDLNAIFPYEITDAVMAITKRDGQTYIQYLEQVASNPLAKAVKIADIKHNLSDAPTAKQIEKYTIALNFLEPNPEPSLAAAEDKSP